MRHVSGRVHMYECMFVSICEREREKDESNGRIKSNDVFLDIIVL